MFVEYPAEKHEELIPFFDSHTRLTVGIQAILKEGLGQVLVDSRETPGIALLSYEGLYMLAGDSQNASAKKLLSCIPRHRIIVAPDEGWENLLKEYWGIRLIPIPRTKFSSSTLDLDHIKKLKTNVADEFILERIKAENIGGFDEGVANELFGFFRGPENFLKRGFGFCVRDGEKVVSFAATGLIPFNNAFETQVMTANSPDYRRKGLATAVCTHLIEYSLEHGFDPRWDAANERSADFALKLGYSNPEPYHVYLHTRLLLKILKKTKLLRILRLFMREH
jgi:GNAT superfamily N-acetyltransferase